MATQPPENRPRAPGITYGIVALAVVVMLAAVALTAHQQPPPSIAELAPQSNQEIKNAPPNQSSRFGSGANGAPGVQAAGPGASPSATTVVPRTHQCFGNPPRQIEDPQSPPCVPYWQGDNGGATAPGVTADQITIAWPENLDNDTAVQAMVKFFNDRFEFYGRKIVLANFDPSSAPVFGRVDVNAQQSDAVRVEQQIKAFASLAYVDASGSEYYYYDHLAQHGIISVTHSATTHTTDQYASFAPYEWNLWTSFDQIYRQLGDFACTSLVGHPAAYMGDGHGHKVSSKGPRRWAVIVGRGEDGIAPDNSVIMNALKDCGAGKIFTAEMTNKQDSKVEGNNIVTGMKDAGTTTVVCICAFDWLMSNIMPAATNQSYFPEYLVSGFFELDLDAAVTQMPQDQAAQMFGLQMMNKQNAITDMPWLTAVKYGYPGFPVSDGLGNFFIEMRYEQLLLLASGIQMAGPHLTPQTFAAGLYQTTFPNPGAGTAPYYQGAVRYGPRDQFFIDDSSIVWWNPGATSDISSAGAYCYYDKGKRFSIGQYPKTPPKLFDTSQPCR